MHVLFVPDDFRVPQHVEQEQFVLRPLTTAEVEKDDEAVMSSKESLGHIFAENDNWPAENMTLQENERDLARHHNDFAQRKGLPIP